MGIVGGRRGPARPRTVVVIVMVATLVGATLSGCSDTVDEARTVQTHLGRIHNVVAVDVATPSPNQTPAITVTYGNDVARPADLADLITAIGDTADDLDYPSYLLTLVPTMEPDSALVVDAGFRGRAEEADVLTAWFAVTSALLGPVTYDAQPAAETITVDAQGAAAHDIAEVQRIGYGTNRTTWVFRSDGSTFTAGGRVRPTDEVLFQTVQRNAGVTGQPVWARSWQLDRRADHVRLDLDVVFGTTLVSPGQLTLARYSHPVGQLARTSLLALAGTRLPVWFSLHCGSDTFASWASGQTPGKGRDPLNRGWDTWLVLQAAAVG